MPVEKIIVWDIFVRVFHWALVASFFIAYVTEDEVMWLHEFAGYTILALLGLRIIWGLIGTKYARFTNFIYKPEIIKQYFFDSIQLRAKRYIGHNPLGGAMVVILMVLLSLTSLTGIMAEESELFEELHEFIANVSLLMVFFHVAGVLFASVEHNENLVRAMISGKKRKQD